MKKAIFIALALVLITAWAAGGDREPRSTLEDKKLDAALSIARLHGLTSDQAILMLGIRDHEDGEKAKKEFGIEGQPECKNDLERYCRNACFCARLIKRFCPNTKPETIKQFGQGYGKRKHRYRGYSEDPDWWKGVIRHSKKHKNILYY